MAGSKRAKVQAFGGFLTSIVIPNIGAFIAWGFITALFIPTGWVPNEHFAKLVGPIIVYLLPLLLGYTGGKLTGGDRGAVMGSIGTIGLIVGSEIPMFLGAMIIGPVGGYLIRKFDEKVEGKIPTGFEMVINNFSIGIIGLGLALLSFQFIGPVIQASNQFVTVMIEKLVATGYLPLLSIINEPAKVLFLNNVIDQGIYYPLGMQEALNAGKSIYFMVASNPGPGLGMLLAFSAFGKGMSKKSAPSAIIIHFFGGIHELYFPYVLMNPVMILAMIAGGMAGITTFNLFGVGLVAGPSPGSIFAYLALTPRGNFLGVIAGVVAATAVAFTVASAILKLQNKEVDDEELEMSMLRSKNMKKAGKALLSGEKATVNFIAFACDAGLGSSALGANAFKKKLNKVGIEKTVKNFAIEKVPQEADVIVVHASLEERAKMKFQDKRIVTIENFMEDPNLNDLYEELTTV
ncbi:PTS mannitol transporter subunit IICB [Anaerotalea alkaliphila]|uniref:PTS system mannitol-specific EIICB component n=1 Tax=Anaerotalea alkaliphila TaxID=2662126 RepID=A0A7X5HXV5_9FIRM|nr:PTS mannitol transporter subunit IICB [Anaerotalea alkaliphila]NDL68647.1 PTS mannitol transporter subunit IICB [Anaerotalea alkaliphila]